MEVRTYGISIDTKSAYVSTDDLFSQLSLNLMVTDEGKNNERRFYINDTDTKYYKGLVVTVKDQKAFCKLQKDTGGKLTIKVENLDEKNRLMEFNFFVINKSNGFGLYQHYHQSCGVSIFGDYLKRFHKNMRDMLAEDAIGKEKGKGSIDIKKEKEIRSRYRDALQFRLLTRPDDLGKILEDLHKIGSFNFEYTTLEAIQREGEPLSDFVRKKIEKVSFIDTASRGDLIKAIVSQVTSFNLTKGTVTGEDESGETKSIKIVDMPEHFGIENFDSVAKKLDNLDVSEFDEHLVIKELLKTCSDNKHIFESKTKDEE